MSVSLYCRYYPKKCNDKEILPFLSLSDNDITYCASRGFYLACKQLSVYDEENYCYIFDDRDKLFEFASRKEVPWELSDYIRASYSDDIPVFIIWVR